jgi:hypothetical protein
MNDEPGETHALHLFSEHQKLECKPSGLRADPRSPGHAGRGVTACSTDEETIVRRVDELLQGGRYA